MQWFPAFFSARLLSSRCASRGKGGTFYARLLQATSRCAIRGTGWVDSKRGSTGEGRTLVNAELRYFRREERLQPGQRRHRLHLSPTS